MIEFGGEQFYAGQTKVKSGSWRDIAVHYRPTQVDCLVGAPVARGESGRFWLTEALDRVGLKERLGAY